MKQLEEFWLVWRDGSTAPRFKHQCKQSAVAEAKRLTKMARGETFFVLKTTAAFVAPHAKMPPPVEVALIKNDGIPF